MQIGVDGQAGDASDTIKVDAPGDPPGQPPNVYDEADAVYSAAHYLQASGAPGDWPGAIFTYNHSSVYVQQVLSLAAGYYTQGLTGQGSTGEFPQPDLQVPKTSVCHPRVHPGWRAIDYLLE